VARPKRSSRLISRAEKRLAGLQSIDTRLDLGEGLTVETFNACIDSLRHKLEAYNRLLSTVDALRIEVKQAERTLGEMFEKALLLVAARYGKNSIEYAQAGGVRSSERKRPERLPIDPVTP
jgi:hypothetical protein